MCASKDGGNSNQHGHDCIHHFPTLVSFDPREHWMCRPGRRQQTATTLTIARLLNHWRSSLYWDMHDKQPAKPPRQLATQLKPWCHNHNVAFSFATLYMHLYLHHLADLSSTPGTPNFSTHSSRWSMCLPATKHDSHNSTPL
jgi:hypothetical protein